MIFIENKFGFDDNTSYEEKVRRWNLDKEIAKNGGPEEVEFMYLYPNGSYKINPLGKPEYGVKMQSRYPLKRKITDVDFVLKRIKKWLVDKPRNVIAKVAARLREVYRKWLAKANKEKDANKLKWYKNILRLILKGIDFVMKKLENIHVSYANRVGLQVEKDLRKQNPYATEFTVGGVKVKSDGIESEYDKYKIIKNDKGYYQVERELDGSKEGYWDKENSKRAKEEAEKDKDKENK